MVIKTGDLIDLGLGESHFLGQGSQVARREMKKLVLEFVEVLNEILRIPRLIAEQGLYLRKGLGVDDPALWRLAATLLGGPLHFDRNHKIVHQLSRRKKPPFGGKNEAPPMDRGASDITTGNA
jgi:hypothetical protein